MFLSALILASKFLQDRNYSTRAWSKISGLGSCEINANEAAFLSTIGWQLFVRDEVWGRWERVLGEVCERGDVEWIARLGPELIPVKEELVVDHLSSVGGGGGSNVHEGEEDMESYETRDGGEWAFLEWVDVESLSSSTPALTASPSTISSVSLSTISGGGGGGGGSGASSAPSSQEAASSRLGIRDLCLDDGGVVVLGAAGGGGPRNTSTVTGGSSAAVEVGGVFPTPPKRRCSEMWCDEEETVREVERDHKLRRVETV